MSQGSLPVKGRRLDYQIFPISLYFSTSAEVSVILKLASPLIVFLHAGSANYQPIALRWLGMQCEAKGFILITEQQNYLQGGFNNGLFCTYKVVLSVS